MGSGQKGESYTKLIVAGAIAGLIATILGTVALYHLGYLGDHSKRVANDPPEHSTATPAPITQEPPPPNKTNEPTPLIAAPDLRRHIEQFYDHRQSGRWTSNNTGPPPGALLPPHWFFGGPFGYVREVDKLDGEARAYFVYEQNYIVAIEKYTETLAKDPTFLSARLWRGITQTYCGVELDRAIEDLSETIKANVTGSTLGYVYLTRALALAAKGKTQDAISDVTRAIELKPHGHKFSTLARPLDFTCFAYLQRAILNSHLGRFESTRVDAAAAISKWSPIQINPTPDKTDTVAKKFADPETVTKWHSLQLSRCNAILAAANLALGESVDAMTNANEAIRLDPTNDVAYLWRAAGHLLGGNAESAVSDLNLSIGHAPTNSLAFSLRAIAFTHLGDDNRAGRDIKAASELSRSQSNDETALPNK
jgi:tetratricopeptide (TPR) repeat protein